MTTYVAFLRAINVGGQSMVKMDVLRRAFERAGGVNVTTYIQSGNVLFDLPAGKLATTVRNVRRNLRVLMGHEPDVVCRTLHDLERAVARAPFLELAGTPNIKLYVTFLSRKPARRPRLPFVSEKEALEIVAMTDREVFIVSRPKKTRFFGFPNEVVETEFSVAATSRNWSTVFHLFELARLRSRSQKPDVQPGDPT